MCNRSVTLVTSAMTWTVERRTVGQRRAEGRTPEHDERCAASQRLQRLTRLNLTVENEPATVAHQDHLRGEQWCEGQATRCP